MLKTLKLLRDSTSVERLEIIDFKSGRDFYYLKIKAEMTNRTTLFIREYLSKTEYNYSYHWQKGNGDLLMRWDNSPHYKNQTFPHHKHLADGKVIESYEAGLEKVLNFIQSAIKTS